MSKELILEEVRPEGAQECGRLMGSEVKIGREPDEGIALNRTSVSRVHGVFQRIRNYWFYRDLGSTNGSWRNGKLAKEGHYVLVRPGDYVQLADIALRVRDAAAAPGAGTESLPAFAPSTLIVFSSDQFADEFPLPEYGRALTVGGGQADLKLEGVEGDVPRLIVERRGERVVALAMGSGPDVKLNGQDFSETQTLGDGDELVLGHYTILFNDPRAQRSGVVPGVSPRAGTSVSALQGLMQGASGVEAIAASATGGMREWGADRSVDHPTTAVERDQLGRQNIDDDDILSLKKRSSGRFTFGQSDYQDDEDPEGTVAMDPEEMEARLADFHPSTRYSMQTQPSSSPLQAIEDKIVLLIGFVLLVGLMALVVWWMLL